MAAASAIDRAVTAVTRQRAVARLRVWLRDTWYDLRFGRLANPELPVAPRGLLFLCKGNICRSPFAAERAAQALGPAVRCTSAGLNPSQAPRPPHEALETAASYGVSLAAHRPQAVTQAVIDAHELIVVMEAGQRAELLSRFPECRSRVFLLPLFDRGVTRGYARYNIEDPFSRPQGAYLACYRRIDAALAALIDALSGPAQAASRPGSSVENP